ncbi:substrate-binding periplasmic protein [Thalassotalea fusca]
MKLHTFILGLWLSFEAFTAEIVKVGLYDFPPYAFVTDGSESIAVQLIDAMNAFQHQYKFVGIPTTSKRRYLDFEKNKFDMIIFEDIKWGWQDYPVTASYPFATGYEVYVTLAKPERDQSFFNDFQDKVMIGVLGYHYQFANFSTDPEFLSKNFKLIQTDGQKKSLELILNNRGDIAVLSKEYLNYHFMQSPQDKDKLLISDKYDQIYNHTVLVRKNSHIAIEYINELLGNMRKKGILDTLFGKYGLEINEQ